MNWLKKIIGKSSPLSEDFEIDLGPEWEPQHEDTHFGFADEVNGQQIIISVLRSKQPLDKPTYYVTAMQQLALKQDAARAMSGGAVEFDDVTSEDRDDGVDLSFFGTDTVNHVQMHVTTIAQPLRTVILSYYKYAPLLSKDDFSTRSRMVREALRVH